MDGLMRHVAAVRNVTLPGDFVAFHLGGLQVGWVKPDRARVLRQRDCAAGDGVIALDAAEKLPALARELAEEGQFVWRGEAFDVRAVPDGPVLATVDRGALPWFGIAAEGVHVNGLVARDDGPHLWVGRRAADRLMDPGKLDHVVAGGIPAGLTREATLIKEGAEEAGFDAALMRQARHVGVVAYDTLRPEGLRRDRLHCYDLHLPDDVCPMPSDGEVTAFELWPMARVVETLRETDDFKFNVALVLIDLLQRLGSSGGEAPVT